MKQSNSLRIITIIAMIFLYAMISFVTNLAAPVGKIWGESFTDPAQAQRMGMLGNLFNFLAYLIMGIPAGNILDKFGYKKTALAAVLLGFIGISIQWFSGVMDSFAVYLCGALVCGFCVCMLNTVGNPMLNLLGGGGKKGNQLNLIGGTFQSFAAALTPMLVGAIIGTELKGKAIDDVNIVLYIAMAVFALIFLILLITPIAEPAAGVKKEYERKTKEEKPVVAICYDFDKTLTPDDMQAQGFIQSVKCDVNSFWEESNGLAEKNDMDQNLAYMYTMRNKSDGKVLFTKSKITAPT